MIWISGCIVIWFIVNLHIERLNTGEYLEEGAALLTVRPLMIESKDVSQHFCKYEPPEE